MNLSRILIKNFRNFKNVDVAVGRQIVIIGENATGKSNLLYGLRLILDPTLPERARLLRVEDFWDGLVNPIRSGAQIEVAIEFQGFDSDARALALLSDCLVNTEPLTARITY